MDKELRMTGGEFCTFHLDGLLYGVPVRDVQEVVRHQELTPVPLAPECVCGLINLRGEIVTAVDLRRRLDLPERHGERPPVHVVLRASGGVVTLLVDAIGDVLAPPRDCFAPVPSTLPARQRELLSAVCQLPERLLLILDTHRAVAV